MNPMDGVVLDPRGRELYLDNGDEPCLRLVEALGIFENGIRTAGCGAFIQHWDGSRWQYVEGPFWCTLSGFSKEALEALRASASVMNTEPLKRVLG